MSSDPGQKPWIEQEQSPIPGIEISNLHLPETAQSRVLGNINYPLHQHRSVDESGTIMLNAAAMKDLLSANVDEHASHYVFFSRAGTIMGHDHAADVKAVKRFAAFAANTWAHNDISIKETGHAVDPLTPGTTILQAVLKEDGGGLHCLVVQVQDLVGAVTHVREGTLLAALKGKEEFAGEGDEVAARVKGVDVSKGSGFAEGVDVAEVDASSQADSSDQGDGVSKGEGSGGEDVGKGKGKEVEEAKPSKMQILVWRSEGMGEYMANELGPKFKIPKGFH